MESLMHYVWKYKLYKSQNPFTCDGNPFEIIDVGIYNSHAGPDFFNAKIKMDDKIWAGNIEIHEAASDWYKHRHDKDKAYNSVVLHVVETIDIPEVRDASGRSIPQWEMKIPENVQANYLFLLNNDAQIPCLGRLGEIPEIYLNDWKSALLTERLERKTNDIFQLLEEHKNDWNEAFYITLARNFGFGINNDAFERLSKSLPLKIILKHSQSPLQTEALFLGQAGLLENDEEIDDYYEKLRNEYLFLKKKYELKPLDGHIFKSLRIRPHNFPHIKLVQLAGIVCNKQGLFSKITEITDKEKFHALFVSDIGEYWKTHYRFGKISAKQEKKLGASAIQILLINVVVPLFFAFGKKKNNPEYTEKALNLLETIAPEKNFITTLFSRSGISILNACDSQALIQLKREYCEQKKCIFCRIGHQLLSK
jgi:hypothetical protein